MRIDIEYKDISFIRDILKEKEELYRSQIVSGYVDDTTPLDTISVIESEQKRVSKIIKNLNQY